jgi:hypothetical protein
MWRLMDENLIWNIRAFVYQWFASATEAPTAARIAGHFGLTAEQAREALSVLHERHALFLEAGTIRVRFANPFSNVPTPFQVIVNGKTYQANCAWDSFGVVAALHAPAAIVHSACAYSGVPIRIVVRDSQVRNTDEVVHFLVPFDRWYEDLVFT